MSSHYSRAFRLSLYVLILEGLLEDEYLNLKNLIVLFRRSLAVLFYHDNLILEKGFKIPFILVNI